MNYNLDYWEHMLRHYAKTGEQIARIRWQWIESLEPRTVLDYGCGLSFFRAYRPQGIEVFTYDRAYIYPQTGIKLQIYDVTCFWDVFEHISDFAEIEPILALSKHIAATVPLKPTDVKYTEWRHFKPGEHVNYWSYETFMALMEKYGFMKIKSGIPECPPRRDIESFLFGKI